MRSSKIITGIASAAGMMILILDGKTAVSGAAEGLQLCIRSVIPSLFPFFILSGLLNGAFIGSKLTFLRPLGALCHIPEGAESLLLTGFLGGYPVGAQNIASAWRSGQLSREQAERMLAFCNNAGPSFLFGMIAPMFSDIKTAWILWGIHIISAILVSLCIPGTKGSVSLSDNSELSLPDALTKAIRVMATVCGWVVLFRVLIAFLDRWFLWILPATVRVALIGLLELSNGCCSLALLDDESYRFLICSIILAFGGICVTMQTVSVTIGLSLRLYFPGKLLQTAISLFFSWAALPKVSISPVIPIAAVCVVAFFALFLRKIQNNSSIPRPLGV